jgi:hypothetical protein
MAYTGTIVAEAEMTFFSGENVDGTGNIEANHNYLAFYAEAYLSNLVKYDIVTNWATIPQKYKYMFTEWAGRFSAISLIAYNMGGFITRIEAERMIQIHAWRMIEIEKLLKDASIQDFIGV